MLLQGVQFGRRNAATTALEEVAQLRSGGDASLSHSTSIRRARGTINMNHKMLRLPSGNCDQPLMASLARFHARRSPRRPTRCAGNGSHASRTRRSRGEMEAVTDSGIGGAYVPALLEPGVPGEANAGQVGDLLPAQARGPAATTVGEAPRWPFPRISIGPSSDTATQALGRLSGLAGG
jgi:hypothetical protein